MAKEVTVSTLRQNLADALVNLDIYEDFLALTSPRFLDSIKEAREDFKKGRVKTIEEVFGQLKRPLPI